MLELWRQNQAALRTETQGCAKDVQEVSVPDTGGTGLALGIVDIPFDNDGTSSCKTAIHEREKS